MKWPFSVEVTSAIIAGAVAIVVSVMGHYISIYKIDRELAVSHSVENEIFDARLVAYPKLLEILLPLSSKTPNDILPEDCHKIVQSINLWLYGRGGLVAHEYTRSAAFNLRNECANWESGPKPEEIDKWKAAIIYFVRNDLQLVARKDVNVESLSRLIDNRNKQIQDFKKLIGAIEAK